MVIISSIQFKPTLARNNADIRANFKKCEDLVNEAWKFGSELVVFPELCLTGYTFLTSEEAWKAAERFDGPTFREMRGVATELSSYVVYGFLEADGDKLHNSSLIISPDGDIVSRYRKVNLWGNDFLWATPGTETPTVVNTDFGTLSHIICRDIRARIPSNIPRQASTPFFKDIKPKYVATCANWGKGGFPSTTWMDFAANHKCNLIISNRYGQETNNNFTNDFGNGGSLIIQKDWKTHTNGLKFNSDCVVSARIED